MLLIEDIYFSPKLTGWVYLDLFLSSLFCYTSLFVCFHASILLFWLLSLCNIGLMWYLKSCLTFPEWFWSMHVLCFVLVLECFKNCSVTNMIWIIKVVLPLYLKMSRQWNSSNNFEYKPFLNDSYPEAFGCLKLQKISWKHPWTFFIGPYSFMFTSSIYLKKNMPPIFFNMHKPKSTCVKGRKSLIRDLLLMFLSTILPFLIPHTFSYSKSFEYA